MVEWYSVQLASMGEWYSVQLAFMGEWYSVQLASMGEWYSVQLASMVEWYSVQLASMGEWYRIHTLHAYKKSYTYAVCYLMSNKVLFCSWFISLCIMTSFVTPSN